MRLRASLHCVSTLMCFLNESHHSPVKFILLLHWQKRVSNPHSWGSLRSGSGCSEMLDSAPAGCKPETIPCCPLLYGANCLLWMSMVSRECPQKQTNRSSTKSALKIYPAIQGGSSFIFSPKHVTASRHQFEHLTLGTIYQSIVSILTRIRHSLRYSGLKNRPSASEASPVKVQMIPYCQGVSYALFKSKKRPTACQDSHSDRWRYDVS